MNKTKVNIFVFFIICVVGLFATSPSNTLFVENSIEAINACEGQLKLSLVRIFGNDDGVDENNFFRLPSHVKIDKDKRVYIVDTGNNRIQVYNRNGKYLQTIGQRGQGPGDLFFPLDLAFDSNNNIIVSDSGNRRIQTLSSNGKYLSSFKTWDNQSAGQIFITPDNDILSVSLTRAIKTGYIVIHSDIQGRIKKEIGPILSKCNSIETLGNIVIAFHNDNIYIAEGATPLYRKYSMSGKLLQIVNYKVPFITPKAIYNNNKNSLSINLENKAGEAVMSSIAVDAESRIYIASTTRPKNEIERKKFFVNGRVKSSPTDSDKTDRFRILVFNSLGKIIASKRLTINCNDLYISDNDLFIIDSSTTMQIFQYKITIFNAQNK